MRPHPDTDPDAACFMFCRIICCISIKNLRRIGILILQIIKDLMSLMGFSMLTEMDAKPTIGTGGVLLAPFRPNGTFDKKTRDICWRGIIQVPARQISSRFDENWGQNEFLKIYQFWSVFCWLRPRPDTDPDAAGIKMCGILCCISMSQFEANRLNSFQVIKDFNLLMGFSMLN